MAAIVTGTLDKRGSGYSLTVKALDTVTGKPLASASVDTATKDELLLQVPKLAAPIRKALGDTTPESVQLAAAQGTLMWLYVAIAVLVISGVAIFLYGR